MTPEFVVEIFRDAFITAFSLAAPLLMIGFGVGVVINLIQVATSLQDSSVSTVPRLAAFLGGLLMLLPWMLNRMTTYTTGIFGDLARYAK
jgi:flagellar biosynthetic protein FliQ